MPLATQGEMPYSIMDAKVYSYSGGVAGTAKDMPGIRRVEMESNIEETEHRGDNGILAVAASFNSVDLTVELGQLNLDALAALSGGFVDTAETTPDQVRTLTRKSTDNLADYQIKAKTNSRTVDGGATWAVFPRCQWVGGPNYSMEDNEFPVIEVTCRAVPAADFTIYQIQQYENATTAIT